MYKRIKEPAAESLTTWNCRRPLPHSRVRDCEIDTALESRTNVPWKDLIRKLVGCQSNLRSPVRAAAAETSGTGTYTRSLSMAAR